MKFLKLILSILFTAALACAVLCIRPYVILSGSMEPELPVGGLVFCNISLKNPQIGDIITYRLDHLLVTHRVVGREGDSLITKGDANKAEDPAPVSKEQVCGTIFLAIPYLGYLFYFIKGRKEILLLLSLSCLFLTIKVLKHKNQKQIEKGEL